MHLTLEPSMGGRILRDEGALSTELSGQVRTSLEGGPGNGRGGWRVSSWQKGRYLSRDLTLPGYLQPGRAEGGFIAQLAFPISERWEVVVDGGADGVRYEPEEWEVLDRQGVTGNVGMTWEGFSRSANISFSASHHAFPHPHLDSDPRRRDTRLGLQVGGALEGRWILRVSAGGSWNQSRAPAYDFRGGRAALALSAPVGEASLQAYASLAHQDYLNPGPEDARVAPSNHDSGSTLSLQYSRPLDVNRSLVFRGTWSRSETGFRNEFYERLGVSLHIAFRGR
jgi:hypothetical protein